jgi:predicted metal-dependent hydrolase
MNKHGRAKRNYNFRLLPNNIIQVSIPPGGTYKHALNIVKSMQPKITKHQEKLKQRNPVHTVFLDKNVFSTHLHQLEIIRGSYEEISGKINEDKISIYAPLDIDIEQVENQDFIRNVIQETWRKEAKTIVPKQVNHFAKKFELEYGTIKINSAKTRWGSCSSVNNLNFSLHLMMLPNELSDYIILHELCHTIHKNHGKDFYNLLNELTYGKHKELNEELKNWQIGNF